eukprot:PhF_6_TR22044/c0_g1_i1/m.31293
MPMWHRYRRCVVLVTPVSRLSSLTEEVRSGERMINRDLIIERSTTMLSCSSNSLNHEEHSALDVAFQRQRRRLPFIPNLAKQNLPAEVLWIRTERFDPARRKDDFNQIFVLGVK